MQRALQQEAKHPSEANALASKLLIDTCVQIMKSSEILQQQVEENIGAFMASAANRTTDKVNQIQMLVT